ncbi:MAG: sulfotransferase family protein [bacterium]
MKQIKEHFFIIGGQRCGTTYLMELLNSHPEIEFAKPYRPEPKYFIGLNTFNYHEYYEKYFDTIKDKKVLGEKSTTYYEKDDALMNIRRFMPNAKIIFVIRNPVERALSNYFFSKMNNIETRTLSETFLKNKPNPDLQQNISTDPFDYLSRGDYQKYLQKCFSIFSREQILILLAEKLFKNDEIEKLEKFLDISQNYLKIPCEKVNSANYNISNMDKEVILSLKKFYAPKVKELEKFLNMNLAIWEL